MQGSRHEVLVEHLIRAVPRLRTLYRKHCRDYDELLPHVFMGDVVRYVTESKVSDLDERCHDTAEILRILEEEITMQDPDTVNLISVSFLENIDWDSAEGHAIWSGMGPSLRKEKSRRTFP